MIKLTLESSTEVQSPTKSPVSLQIKKKMPQPQLFNPFNFDNKSKKPS